MGESVYVFCGRQFRQQLNSIESLTISEKGSAPRWNILYFDPAKIPLRCYPVVVCPVGDSRTIAIIGGRAFNSDRKIVAKWIDLGDTFVFDTKTKRFAPGPAIKATDGAQFAFHCPFNQVC